MLNHDFLRLVLAMCMFFAMARSIAMILISLKSTKMVDSRSALTELSIFELFVLEFGNVLLGFIAAGLPSLPFQQRNAHDVVSSSFIGRTLE